MDLKLTIRISDEKAIKYISDESERLKRSKTQIATDLLVGAATVNRAAETPRQRSWLRLSWSFYYVSLLAVLILEILAPVVLRPEDIPTP